MDCLRFRSLKGIQADATEKKKLTPVSPDIFVSIPARDSSTPHQYCDCVRLRPLPKLSHGVGH